MYVRWSSFIPINNILSIRSRNAALLLESNTFGNLLTENSLAKVYLLTPFWFSSLLPISLFSFSTSLYSLTFLMSLLFLSLPRPFLFSSFLLLCLTVCFSTFFLSLLHLAPLKVFTNDAAQNLRVERSQHSLQDCRMMEFEASNKVIPVLWDYSNRTLELEAWKILQSFMLIYLLQKTTFLPSSHVHFLGWPLVPFSQCFLWERMCSLATTQHWKNFVLHQKLWESMRITVLKAEIIFCLNFCIFTSSVHLIRQ